MARREEKMEMKKKEKSEGRSKNAGVGAKQK